MLENATIFCKILGFTKTAVFRKTVACLSAAWFSNGTYIRSAGLYPDCIIHQDLVSSFILQEADVETAAEVDMRGRFMRGLILKSAVARKSFGKF